jgi:hypothetical protein
MSPGVLAVMYGLAGLLEAVGLSVVAADVLQGRRVLRQTVAFELRTTEPTRAQIRETIRMLEDAPALKFSHQLLAAKAALASLGRPGVRAAGVGLLSLGLLVGTGTNILAVLSAQ